MNIELLVQKLAEYNKYRSEANNYDWNATMEIFCSPRELFIGLNDGFIKWLKENDGLRPKSSS